MKYPAIIILFLFILSSCKSHYHSLAGNEKEKYQLPKYSSNTQPSEDHLVALRSQNITELIEPHQKNIIVFFTSWCPYSKETIPELLTNIEESDINLILITPDDFYFKGNYEKYREELDYSDTIYFLDAEVYNSWNQHKKMKAFMKEAFPSIKNVKGFPSGLYLEEGIVVASGIIDSDFIKSHLAK